MRCEKCGAQIPEGKLYCEKCGHGIQIVPDYNPELEERIAKTLEKLVHEEFGNYRANEQQEKTKIHMDKKQAAGILCATGLCLLAFGMMLGTHVKHLNSYEYQFTKAVEYAHKKDKTQEAMDAYEKVLELDKSSYDICISLADIFEQQKKYDLAETCLLTAIERAPADIDTYRKLIDVYEENNKYDKITELLEHCDNQDIRMAFAAYNISEPTVNLKEGNYEDSLTLVLKTDTRETIYYTLDGSEPTLNSSVYRKPITLEEGKYILRAIGVNTKGMISTELKKEYNIQLEVPLPASVFPDGGEYTEPTDILVEVAVGNTAYYTLDGSTPSKNSIKYTKPVPMRLGQSVFSCIVYGANGKVSEVVRKEYNLNLNTTYEAPEAISTVRNIMLNTGETYDLEGHAIGIDGTYSLNCNEATVINGITYLLVTKRLNLSDGTVQNFDYKYGVNAENIGEVARVYSNSEGVYTLEAPY